MWIFGGEYASPTKSQFHHYKDLWVYYIASQSWEQVRAPGGPSARSGHRMVLVNRQLLLFGGFHESFRDYRYFNDVYLFRLDLRTWTKLEFSNSGPSPRSGCQLLPVGEAKALVYGGYSREKTKSEFDQGKAFGDMYLLQCDPENSGKCKWSKVKQAGCQPGPRSGMSVAALPHSNRAYFFGGVQDQEMEETLVGHFFNDLFCLDMDKGFWQSVTLKGDKGIVQLGDSSAQEEGPHEGLHKLHIEEPVVTSDDGVFTVTIGASKHKAPVEPMHHEPTTSKERKDTFAPVSRMGSCMAIKHGVLYLYGGVFEDEDRQFTLSDMYGLDLRKLDEWKVLVPLAPEAHEWLGSDDSDLESEESDVEDEDDEDSEKVVMVTLLWWCDGGGSTLLHTDADIKKEKARTRKAATFACGVCPPASHQPTGSSRSQPGASPSKHVGALAGQDLSLSYCCGYSCSTRATNVSYQYCH